MESKNITVEDTKQVNAEIGITALGIALEAARQGLDADQFSGIPDGNVDARSIEIRSRVEAILRTASNTADRKTPQTDCKTGFRQELREILAGFQLH